MNLKLNFTFHGFFIKNKRLVLTSLYISKKERQKMKEIKYIEEQYLIILINK